MPNGLTPEQEAMAAELEEAKQTARRKMLKMSEPDLKEKAATKTKETGKKAEKTGKVIETYGKGMEMAGKAMEAGGRATKQAGTSVTRAGVGLTQTGVGAIVGVPMAAAGGIMTGAGAGAEVTGKGTRVAGGTIKKGGRMVKETGKKFRQMGEQAEEMFRGPKELERLKELATKKMMAKLAVAATPEEAELRQQQLKRMLDTVKKFKKIMKAGSAATVIGIIYLYLSFAKDYLLGNLINGDPTGLFVKKKGIFGVAPLSFPEVLLFLAVTWSMFLNWLVMWWPIILLAIIAFAVATVDFTEIKDLVAEFGLDVVNPILEELGVPTIPGL